MNARREACTKSVVVAMAMEMEAVNGQPAKVIQRQPTDPSKGVIIIWVVGLSFSFFMSFTAACMCVH